MIEKRTSKAESPKKASSKTNVTVGQKSEANSQQIKQHKTSSELSTSEKEKKTTEENSSKNGSKYVSSFSLLHFSLHVYVYFNYITVLNI